MSGVRSIELWHEKLVYFLSLAHHMESKRPFRCKTHTFSLEFQGNVHQTNNNRTSSWKSNNTKSVTVNPILNVPKRSIRLHKLTHVRRQAGTTSEKKFDPFFTVNEREREKEELKIQWCELRCDMREDEWGSRQNGIELDPKKGNFSPFRIDSTKWGNSLSLLLFLYSYKRMI